MHMVRKKGVILSLILLSSGIVYSDDSSILASSSDSQASSSDTTIKSVVTELLAADGSMSDNLSTSASDSTKNPSISDEQALARQQLVPSQLETIAQNVVEELVTVTQWTENHVRFVREKLSQLAGEHRVAAVRAIDDALQAKLREVNVKLGDSITSADAIAQLRVQSDNLRRAEAGLRSAAPRIIAYASEADAEMAAMLMPGSPRTKRIATQVVAGLSTAAAITFGTLWWLGKGAAKAN